MRLVSGSLSLEMMIVRRESHTSCSSHGSAGSYLGLSNNRPLSLCRQVFHHVIIILFFLFFLFSHLRLTKPSLTPLWPRDKLTKCLADTIHMKKEVSCLDSRLTIFSSLFSQSMGSEDTNAVCLSGRPFATCRCTEHWNLHASTSMQRSLLASFFVRESHSWSVPSICIN